MEKFDAHKKSKFFKDKADNFSYPEWSIIYAQWGS